MKVQFELDNVDSTLLMKMPSSEDLANYKVAKEKFEASGNKGTPPALPEFQQYKPLQLVELTCVKAIRENVKAGKPDQLRHLVALFNSLANQTKENKDSYDLPETDIRFIMKCIAKTQWPTENVELVKFIVMVEQSFINAIK